MKKSSSKKLSRRDAMKVVVAAIGAATLANLPSKWSKPELAAGVLPAHAQTSLATLLCNTDIDVLVPFNPPVTAEQGPVGVTISPAAPGVEIFYDFSGSGASVTTPSGSAFTDASGYAEILIDVNITTLPSSVAVEFYTLSASCTQTVNFEAGNPKTSNNNGWRIKP